MLATEKKVRRLSRWQKKSVWLQLNNKIVIIILFRFKKFKKTFKNEKAPKLIVASITECRSLSIIKESLHVQ
jgi:hypothetical protein